jgi:hypothetical protein
MDGWVSGVKIGYPPPDVKPTRAFNRGIINPTGTSKMVAYRQGRCKSEFFNGFIFAKSVVRYIRQILS